MSEHSKHAETVPGHHAGGTVPPLVIMGVSGSGKSTVGGLLAAALKAPFHDADDLHPRVNKEKMRAGVPLDDNDRYSWLQRVGRVMREEIEHGRSPIVACSALKRAHRDLIRSAAPTTVFVHLEGNKEFVRARMGARRHEFMPDSLLDSQYETLESPDDDELHIDVDLTLDPDQLVALIRDRLVSLPQTAE